MPQFLFVDHPDELMRIPEGDSAFGLEPRIGHPELNRFCDLGVLRGGTNPQGHTYGLVLDALGLISHTSATNRPPLLKVEWGNCDRLWIVSAHRTLETMVAMLVLEDALRPEPVLFPRPRTREEREAELFHCRNQDPTGIMARLQAVDESARFLRGEIAAWPGPQGGQQGTDHWVKHGFPSEVMDLAGPNQLVQWSADPTFPQDLVLAALRHWLMEGTPDLFEHDDDFDLANKSVWAKDPVGLLRAATTHAFLARAAFIRHLDTHRIRPAPMDNEKVVLLNLSDETVPPSPLVRTGLCVAPVVAFVYEQDGMRRYAVVPFHDRYFDHAKFLKRVAALETSGRAWRVTHPREPLGNAVVSPAGVRSEVGFTAFLALVQECCR